MRKLYKVYSVLSALALGCWLNGSMVSAASIAGKIGVGTWNTQAEFTNVQVTQGAQAIYQSDFTTGMSGFAPVSGTWQAVGGNLRQTSTNTPALAYAGDLMWSDYTLTLKARKLSGAEGFLISFASPGDGSKAWWNIGGWGDTQHAIEYPGISVPAVAGAIVTGVWYDIRVEVQGLYVRCYLNGALVHDTHPAPLTGKIGVGTWNTQADFTNVKVSQGTQTLYQSDFSTGFSGFAPFSGTWAAQSGSLRQTSSSTPAMAYVGNSTWSNYTVTLQARKLSGAEGFLISFASPADGSNKWWNIGGWSNTQQTIQYPGTYVPFLSSSVQTGRWYSIRIDVQATAVRCYLDGGLIYDTERVLDATDRSSRFLELLNSPGFSVLNPGEQQWLRDLSARSVYVGDAARATFVSMPSEATYGTLNTLQQAAVIRKVNRNRMTYGLGGGFGSDAARDQGIIAGMDAAVILQNTVGPVFDKNDTINNSPGTATADGSENGTINFGNSYNERVSLHEMSHTLGTGTHWNWSNLMVNGLWTGQFANAQLAQFDGAGSILHGDSAHYWPYGLNYDSEYSDVNAAREVWMVHALRKDMGIATWDLTGSTSVPNGIYSLSPRHAPGSALDVLNANPANAAQIDIRAYTAADSQKFRIDLQGDGSYRLRTILPGNRCVELPSGNTANGTQLQLFDDNGNAAQKWYLIPEGSGYYRLSPKNNIYKAMDVAGLATTDGTLIQSWDYLDGLNQQWYLKLLVPAFTTQDLAKTLLIAGGLTAATSADANRLDVAIGTPSTIDLSDAVAIARKISGLGPNP